jgi:hypothetical protein
MKTARQKMPSAAPCCLAHALNPQRTLLDDSVMTNKQQQTAQTKLHQTTKQAQAKKSTHLHSVTSSKRSVIQLKRIGILSALRLRSHVDCTYTGRFMPVRCCFCGGA